MGSVAKIAIYSSTLNIIMPKFCSSAPHHSVCKLILLQQSYFVTPVEQHKVHVLINMEQYMLLMMHALQDMHDLDGALGLYKDLVIFIYLLLFLKQRKL